MKHIEALLCSTSIHQRSHMAHLTGNDMMWTDYDVCISNGKRSKRVIKINQYKIMASWLVGLDLFNDDTRPSGYISRPTQ